MLTRFVRIQLAIFALVSVVGLVVMALNYLQLPSMLGLGRIAVTIELPNSGGLYRFANVTYRGVQVALAARDRFGTLLAGGIVAWFIVQTTINVGGVTGLLPVTGLTLPFFSAGGTSLFVCMAASGLLLNVARHAK